MLKESFTTVIKRGKPMSIRGIMITVTALVHCQAFAQTVVPEGIEQLQEVLTTEQRGLSIEIPAPLAQDWLQQFDPDAWTAIQQQMRTAIDLDMSMFRESTIPTVRRIDGIDPFAIYGENGELDRLLIRGIGEDPSIFAERLFADTRNANETTIANTSRHGDEETSSMTQKILAGAQDAADAVCGMTFKPKEVSFAVNFGYSLIWHASGTIAVTYETEALCRSMLRPV